MAQVIIGNIDVAQMQTDLNQVSSGQISTLNITGTSSFSGAATFNNSIRAETIFSVDDGIQQSSLSLDKFSDAYINVSNLASGGYSAIIISISGDTALEAINTSLAGYKLKLNPFDDYASFEDTINFKGLQYADDYSANFDENTLVTKAYVDSKFPYTSYVSILSQTSVNAPTAVEIYNNIGTMSYEYFDTGVYYIKNTGAFPVDKTWCMIGQNPNGYQLEALRLDDDNVVIKQFSGGSPLDEFTNIPIEIRVYQ